MRVYNLRGYDVQAIPAPPAPSPEDAPGRFNNVDIVYGVQLGGQTVDLTVSTDRGREYGVSAEFNPDIEECTIRYDQDPGFGGQHLSADAEGLTIYYSADLNGYLLASSQGDSTFAVYERTDDNAYVGGFRATSARRHGLDGVQACDGAAVINVPLGFPFQSGLLVVHDGQNTPKVFDGEGEVRANTNFKFIRWGEVARAFDPPLLIDRHSWDPRP